ncbi:hypothetical protein PYW08_012288 [Mythimna loreyi]|uniref:Uncharacterized protein n=1 Tax=Mythimna loreyi TaxID=667449 RepID=A0ACC2PZV6_9NEOP|nr:hypothetical protein PYW08_012288 [Mythimna loreyi]
MLILTSSALDCFLNFTENNCTMTSRGRYSQGNEWDSRDDYNSSVYEQQYPDDDCGSDVNLDHCRLYIRNIPKALNEEGLRSAFAKFGTLVEVFLSKDPQKNYALVKYETPGEAKLAMMKMNRTEPLKLQIHIAHKSKANQSNRTNRDWQDRNTNVGRDRSDRSLNTSNREDTASVASRGRTSRVQEEIPNGDNNMDDLMMEDDYGFSDILDPNLHLELENLKLEQLKVREEQLQCKQRVILLKQAERKPISQMSNRCILPDGKIVVRNVESRDSRDADVSFSAGAGDSNDTTICSCKVKNKCSWEIPQTDGSSTPSTCVLCSEDPSENRHYRDKSVTNKASEKKFGCTSKVVDSKTTAATVASKNKKSDFSKVTDTYSKRSDATSKLKRCGKCRSEITSDLKYSDFYTDSDDEDETNRLIQLRNADYLDIVEQDLKLVIALAGYPKSKMKLRQMEQFQRSLTDVIDMQLKAGLLKRVPSFLDYYLNRGALVCICKDVDTRDWMVRVSPGLQERMCTNLVLLKARVKRLCLAVLKIPSSCWPATAHDAFKLLQYFNPTLKTNLWKIYAQKTIDTVEYTSFLIDRVSGEIIRGPAFKNVIDYGQMEFELTGYTEIYYECLLSNMEEDLRSIASRVKLLDEIRSTESTPRNASDHSLKAIAVAKPEEKITQEESDDKIETEEKDDVRKELESTLQDTNEILMKLKDVKYISDKDEVLVWSDETNNYSNDMDVEKSDLKEKEHIESNVAVSDKTESFIESTDNLISRSSTLNIDSNRGIAYHRRTNYLHVEHELKVAITLEGYPQNKLEGTHIRRLKHLFKEYLHKDMKLQRFANLIIPKFQDIYLSNGAVIYICDSLETKDYLTEVLPKFINSTGLKLTFRDIKSLVRYTRIVMRLPKEHAHVESVELLLKLQAVYPGLKPDCWKYYSDVAGKQKRQFGVDPESLEVIKRPDFDPHYEGDKLTIRIIDRQKRDVSFDETSKEIGDVDTKKHRDGLLKKMYVPIDPEIMAAPLTRVRTNHYTDLIADDQKLYVGPLNYPESRIDETVFHSIKRTFESIVVEALDQCEMTEESMPKFHDMYLFDGVIFIICHSMLSRYWIEEAIPTVNSKLHMHLKATEFRGAVGIVSMICKTDKDTDEVITILQDQNPRLRTKYWRKISTVRTKSKLDVVLQIDKLSAQVITAHNFNKFVGGSAVQFRLGHLQSLLKPKASLEEVTKQHAKKLSKKLSELEAHEKKSKITMSGSKGKSFDDLKSQLKKDYPHLKLEQWNAMPQPPDAKIAHNVCNLAIDEDSEKIIKKESLEISLGDQKIYFYTENKTETEEQAVIEPVSPKSANEIIPENHGYHKIIMKVPVNILPENKDDLNIIFDLLEDKNPGLNTELWQAQLKLPGLQRVAVRQCVVCGGASDAFCAGCGITPYCSETCQKRDWQLRHRDVCHNLARMHNENARAGAATATMTPATRAAVTTSATADNADKNDNVSRPQPAMPLRRPYGNAANNRRDFVNRQDSTESRNSTGAVTSQTSAKSNGSFGDEDQSKNGQEMPRRAFRRNFNQEKKTENVKAASPVSPKVDPLNRRRNQFQAPAKTPEEVKEQKKAEPAPAPVISPARQRNLVPKTSVPDSPTEKPEVVKPQEVVPKLEEAVPKPQEAVPKPQEAVPPPKKTESVVVPPPTVPPASVSDVTPTRKLVPKNYLLERMSVGDSIIMSVDAKASDCRITRGDFVCLTMAEAFELDYHSLCEDFVVDCNKDDQPVKLIPGETVSYFNPEDCGWYRARCLNPTTLALLDSGRIVTVTATDKCRKLPAKYDAVPEFCAVLVSKTVELGASLNCKILSQTSNGYKISMADVETNASLGEGEVFRWLPTVEYQPIGIPEVSRPALVDGSTVVLVLADTLDKVFVRPADADSQRQYDDVLQQVLLSAIKAKPLTEPPTPGQTVIGKFVDDCFYRALVRRVNVKQNKYQIEYAEYGNIEISTLENLYPCPADFDLSNVKTQVSMLKLAPPTEISEAAKEFVQELMQDVELLVSLRDGRKTAPSGSEADLAIAKNRLDVGARLVEMCLPNWKKIEQRGGDVIETEPIMFQDIVYVALPKSGCTVEVLDISVLKGGAICGYDRSDTNADTVFNQLTAKMADYCNSDLGREPYLPKPEELCIAQLPPYPQWFRAVFLDLVSGPGSSEAKICYLDYGNISNVPVTLLRKMMPEFITGIPVMGLYLEIRDFPQDASDEMLARAVLHMNIDDEGRGTLKVSNCEKQADGIYLVDAPELLAAMKG